MQYRNDRQGRLVKWATEAFGEAHTNSVQQRAVRFLEEAIELYQACGADRDMAHRLVDYFFARPPGEIDKELGGVGVTTLLLASAAGVSAEQCELTEFLRVLRIDPAVMAERNRLKNEAGFDTTGAYPVDLKPWNPSITPWHDSTCGPLLPMELPMVAKSEKL